MPEYFREGAKITARLYPHCGEGMAEGMNTAWLYTCLLQVDAQAAGDVVSVCRFAGYGCKYILLTLARLTADPGRPKLKALAEAHHLDQRTDWHRHVTLSGYRRSWTSSTEALVFWREEQRRRGSLQASAIGDEG